MAQLAPIDEKAPHILIVDDDRRIRELLQRYLSENGYRASVASDGRKAQRLLSGVAFDLLILDVMMPEISGMHLTEVIRKSSDIPVILLTARGLPEDRIEGLERGADDYLTKPFEPRELILRVAALLRRRREQPEQAQPLSLGAWVFHPTEGELRQGTEIVKLNASETALLRFLGERPGVGVSREDIAQAAEMTQERSVDVQVTRLRKKIDDDPKTPTYLKTIRGVGYALFPDP
ncbi:MAG: response regulator transcription factor [Pseudomonadota bacterium]